MYLSLIIMKMCEDAFCNGQAYGNTACENYTTREQSQFQTFGLPSGAEKLLYNMPYSLVLFNIKGCILVHSAEKQGILLKDGQMILIAQSSFMKIIALRRCTLFTMELTEYYGFCHNMYHQLYGKNEIEYDYRPTNMAQSLVTYLNNCSKLLNCSMLCRKMCDLKRREFFFYLNMLYTPKQMSYFLYPVLGSAVNFRRTVMEHIAHVSTATELAECSGYSRCVFYKKFRDEFNMPVKKWIVKQKMEQINMLVTKPGVSVKELMYMCGYSSGGHFNDFFKKYFNCTPNEYIKRFVPGK